MLLSEYMKSKFDGKYLPFNDGEKMIIQVSCVGRNAHPAHSDRQARKIAKKMRADGWKVRLSNGLLYVTL